MVEEHAQVKEEEERNFQALEVAHDLGEAEHLFQAEVVGTDQEAEEEDSFPVEEVDLDLAREEDFSHRLSQDLKIQGAWKACLIS
mmetsp:Transcript_23816/g.42166  ORF Transcript_23816/g.42166 Transcript_23816/m.42166 type:complete len:85 (+) Transcript_23816:2279-2533(+)